MVWLTPLGPGSRSRFRAPIGAFHAANCANRIRASIRTSWSFRWERLSNFPNKDPFLHNVFSLFDGKRFDLGFYEAGSSKTVHFDRPGVSFLFCNIHPEMSGAVVAVDTPYFGMSDRNGRVTIQNVPDGRYQLNVWYERSLPEDLKAAGRTVTISDATRSLEPVRVVENPNFTLEHKNKYGQDYIPPANTSPAYNPCKPNVASLSLWGSAIA